MDAVMEQYTQTLRHQDAEESISAVMALRSEMRTCKDVGGGGVEQL